MAEHTEASSERDLPLLRRLLRRIFMSEARSLSLAKIVVMIEVVVERVESVFELFELESCDKRQDSECRRCLLEVEYHSFLEVSFEKMGLATDKMVLINS